MADFSHHFQHERYEPVPFEANTSPAYPQESFGPGSRDASKHVTTSWQDLPSANIEQIDEKPKKRKPFRGKRLNLLVFALLTFVAFAFNVGWLVWAQLKYGISKGYGTIIISHCSNTKNWGSGLHALINVLSTCVLLASHGFMQAFSSPTREELDNAHRRLQWLHVGVLSMRNLFGGVAKRKVVVVIVLLISSLPYHLLYNSMVFTAYAGNEYVWAVVTQDFMNNQPWTAAADVSPSIVLMQENYQSYDFLDVSQCVEFYAQSFLTDHRNLILVSSQTNPSNSVLAAGKSSGVGAEAYSWMCSQTSTDSSNCNATAIDGSDWTVFTHPIDSACYVEAIPETCALQFSLDILIVVLICNLLKLSAMVFVLIRYDVEDLLTCPGDAMTSFLNDEDTTTMGMCLATERDIQQSWCQPRQAKRYTAAKHSYTQAVSRRRWYIMLVIIGGVILVTVGLYLWAAYDLQKHGRSPSNFSWTTDQTPDGSLLSKSSNNAAAVSLLANLPQLILALLTLGMNGLLTSIFYAKDFSKFATQEESRYLMVSSPRNKQQRSVWMLGIPNKPGIFILIMSIVLHFLLSQSLFAVQLVIRRLDGTVDDSSRISNCEYSTAGMIYTAGAFLILGLSVFYFTDPYVRASWRRGFADHFSNNQRRFERELLQGSARNIQRANFIRHGHPPTFSTCSAAISASCHVPAELRHDDMDQAPLRWGAVMTEQDKACQRDRGYGHCTLAPAVAWQQGLLVPPTVGAWYAGTDSTEVEDVDLHMNAPAGKTE